MNTVGGCSHVPVIEEDPAALVARDPDMNLKIKKTRFKLECCITQVREGSLPTNPQAYRKLWDSGSRTHNTSFPSLVKNGPNKLERLSLSSLYGQV